MGTIVLSNITQNVKLLGGLWSRRPIPGIAFLVGSSCLVAVPPFGTFWALAPLATYLQSNHPLLLLLFLTVNGLTGFSLMRLFLLVWGGQPKQMTVRSPEGLWFMVLPVTILTGFILHVPQLLIALKVLPDLSNFTSLGAIGLLLAGIAGGAGAVAVYANPSIPKPVEFPYPAVQNFFAYDLYTAQFYRATIVATVDTISRCIDFIDRYLVDGLVNFLGLATLLSGQGLKYNVSGQVQSYALTIVLGVATIVVLIIWPLIR
jgi:NAD(P)H-quinone oxidoreductase subunit 5